LRRWHGGSPEYASPLYGSRSEGQKGWKMLYECIW
jgi:hypothetical protein